MTIADFFIEYGIVTDPDHDDQICRHGIDDDDNDEDLEG